MRYTTNGKRQTWALQLHIVCDTCKCLHLYTVSSISSSTQSTSTLAIYVIYYHSEISRKECIWRSFWKVDSSPETLISTGHVIFIAFTFLECRWWLTKRIHSVSCYVQLTMWFLLVYIHSSLLQLLFQYSSILSVSHVLSEVQLSHLCHEPLPIRTHVCKKHRTSVCFDTVVDAHFF